MRIALRQQPAQRGEMVEPVERVRRREERGGTQVGPLDDVIAEVLIEPGTPGCAHPVARLQDGLEPRAGAAADETEMAPVFARHQLGDGIGLAMTPRAEHNPDIGPLHGLPDFPKANIRAFSEYIDLLVSSPGLTGRSSTP